MKKIALLLACLMTICHSQDSGTTKKNELTERKLKIAQQCLKNIGKELTEKKIKTDSDDDLARTGELIKSEIESRNAQLERNRAVIKHFIAMNSGANKRLEKVDIEDLQPADVQSIRELMQLHRIDLDRVTLLDHHIKMLQTELAKRDAEVNELTIKLKKVEPTETQR